MRATTLSIAQSLRAIGQALEVLRIDTFKLEKRGDKYIIRNWEGSYLDGVVEKVWGLSGSDQMPFSRGERKAHLVYTSSDSKRLESQGRMRRGSKSIANARNVSLPLRIIGDYLDGKQVMAFDIAWSMQSITIRYETFAHAHNVEHFTLQSLHKLGLRMHLRRSGRQAEKS